MSTPDVKSGFWADHNRPFLNRYQLLLDERWAGILTNAIAVLITSTSGPIFTLLIGPLSWMWDKISTRWGTAHQDPIDEANNYGEALGIVLRNLRHAGGGYVNLPIHGPATPNGRAPANILGRGIIFVALMGLPVAIIVASIVSAGLATDSIGLSDCTKCGRYVYRPDPGKSSTQFLEFEHRAEAQAGSYAASCYGPSSLVDHCTKFYNQSIPYSIESPADCPFQGDVCEGGVLGAYRLTTGLVPGSVLGIDAANPFLFSRTMTCSPLVSDEDYVGIGRSKRGFDQWEYWYGKSLANYTWANPVDESAWEIKGYSTGIHCSEPGSRKSPFVPLPEFTAGLYPVTLMFISSHSIMYPHTRSDPVFPAHTRAKFPPEYPGPPQYFNNSTRAGILGCVDKYEICKSVNGPCWTNGNATSILQAPDNRAATTDENVASLLLHAMDLSTACGSTQFRGAEALDAQTKIAHMQSLELAPRQWEVEAEKMFQASLTRIQLNVFDIARGSAGSFTNYQDVMPKKYRGICHLVAIRTVGWKNVNFLGLLGIILGVAVLWGISRKRKDINGDKALVIVLLWHNYLEKACIWTWKHVQHQILEPSRRFLLRLF